MGDFPESGDGKLRELAREIGERGAVLLTVEGEPEGLDVRASFSTVTSAIVTGRGR